MDWSIVLAASEGYIDGVNAFLNSFEHYHNRSGEQEIKVYLLSHRLPQEFTDDIYRSWLTVIPIDITKHEQYQRGNAWATKIPRFDFASGVSGVVMLADADMFFCANMSNYFKIAEIGFIVAGLNGSHFGFNQSWRDKYKLPQLPDFFDYKTITSVPTIMDTSKHGEVWASVHEHKITIETGADFDLQNIYMVIHKKIDHIIPLPAQQVTGIHHFMLKPDTGVMRKEGKLVTRDGFEVLMVHGKWWQKGWFDNLMVHMDRYCRGDNRYLSFAEKSRAELKKEFDRWAYLTN